MAGSYVDNKAHLMWGMGYLAGLHVRLGAKIGDLHAKDSSLFRKRLILSRMVNSVQNASLSSVGAIYYGFQKYCENQIKRATHTQH